MIIKLDSKLVVDLLLGLPEGMDGSNTLVEDYTFLMSKLNHFKLAHTLREGAIVALIIY